MSIAWNRAACRDEGDPEIFFPLNGWDSMTPLALAICASCPIQLDCGDYALITGQVDGIWGGLTEDDRRSIRRRDRQEGAVA